MKIKSYFLPALAGTIIYYLLGGLFYGLLYPDIYPQESETSMSFIALGSFVYAFLFALILHLTEKTQTFKSGFSTGLKIGFLYSLSMNFFMFSAKEINIEHFVVGIAYDSIATAIMAGIIGFTISKLK
jgi:hypothetical protein